MPIHGRNLDPPFDIVRASPSELGMRGRDRAGAFHCACHRAFDVDGSGLN